MRTMRWTHAALAVYVLVLAPGVGAETDAPEAPQEIRGEALETRDTSAYTYVQLQVGEERIWAVVDLHTTVAAIAGASFGVIKSTLEGRLPDDADSLLAAQILHVLGLTMEEANEIAFRPLPGLAASGVHQENDHE